MNAKELPGKVNTGDTLAAVQLCPFGEWPNGATVQKCDVAAFHNLMDAWRAAGAKEIICDFEHRFKDPSLTSDTSAAAWISNLAVDGERGLVGDLKFTDQGADAVANRRLRFLPPVWPLDAHGRTARLKSVALTNTPNIPVSPVLNKKFPDGLENPETPGNPETKETFEMDKLSIWFSRPRWTEIAISTGSRRRGRAAGRRHDKKALPARAGNRAEQPLHPRKHLHGR